MFVSASANVGKLVTTREASYLPVWTCQRHDFGYLGELGEKVLISRCVISENLFGCHGLTPIF